MKRKAMLAVDMGASNGRVVWGQWHESGLECREIHRFDNVPIQRNGLMCWDMPRLMVECYFVSKYYRVKFLQNGLQG